MTVASTSFVSFLVRLFLWSTLLVLPWCATATATAKKTVVSAGLVNLGNTCYLNAQLQCAFHVPYVRRLLLRERDGDPSLGDVFDAMATSSSSATSPAAWCRALGLNVFEQQDAQEFWKLLLPSLRLPALTELYAGAFANYLTAQDGSGRERRQEEAFTDLSLEVGSGSVSKSIRQAFSQPELLSAAEGNGWRPEKGADPVDALKGSSLKVPGLPSLLQLHLKRFNYDWNTDTMSKINDPCTFPKELDLSSVCTDVSEAEVPFAFYDLQSVVVHAGGYGNGHYYSYVRPNVTSPSWYRFDDARVTKVSWSDVKRDSFGGEQPRKKQKRPSHKSRDVVVKRGFWGRVWGAVPPWGNSGGTGTNNEDVYGYGGRHSSAYMLQYARRCDVPKLYGD